MGKHGTKIKKEKFLKAYAKIGTVTHAAKAVGVGRRTVSMWCNKDKAFLAAYQDAQEEAVEALELEAKRRAHDGTNEPVFYQGQRCGIIRRYSDTLLIFLLKAARPEKYRDQAHLTVSGANGGPIQTAVSFYLPKNGRDEQPGT